MQYLHRRHHVRQAARLFVVRRPEAWTLNLDRHDLRVEVLGQKQILVQVPPVRDQGHRPDVERGVVHEQGHLGVQVPSEDILVYPPEGASQFDQQPPMFDLEVFRMEVDDPLLKDTHGPEDVVRPFLEDIGELEDLATVSVHVELFHHKSGEGILPRAGDAGDHKDQRLGVIWRHGLKCIRGYSRYVLRVNDCMPLLWSFSGMGVWCYNLFCFSYFSTWPSSSLIFLDIHPF